MSSIFTEILGRHGSFLAGNVFEIGKGLSLPLHNVGSLRGDAGFGGGRPALLALENGVAVLRRGRLALFSHDLGQERWGQDIPSDSWNRTLVAVGNLVFTGPIGGAVTVYRSEDGKVVREVPCEGLLESVGEHVLVLSRNRVVSAVDWQGEVLWARAGLVGQVVAGGGCLLMTDGLNRALSCVDAVCGKELWRFMAAPLEDRPEETRWTAIPSGFPSVVVVGDRVFVFPLTGIVYVLSLATGTVLSEFQPPFLGHYLVTDRSIFFMSARGLAELDHREMREVERIEYWDDVAALYGDKRVTVNAYSLSEESVVWTTMHGALMGVSRTRGTDGRRMTWHEEIPGAMMPIAETPITYGGYLYFTNSLEPFEVRCYVGCR